VPLPTALRGLLSAKGADEVEWSRSVFCTRNFFCTVARTLDGEDSEDSKMDEYLRLVDAYVVWPSTVALLLLSDREADAILALMWDLEDGERTTHRLIHLAFSRPDRMGGGVAVRQGAFALPCVADDAVEQDGTAALPPVELATLHILSGETSLVGEAVHGHMRRLLPTEGASHTAEEMVGMRGMLHMLPRSDLEKVLRVMPSERLSHA
jgi:hypothetical protein